MRDIYAQHARAKNSVSKVDKSDISSRSKDNGVKPSGG